MRDIFNGALMGTVVFLSACATGGADRGRMDEEANEGEALYWSNLHVRKSGESNGISSSIVSQEFLTWKRRFIESHGDGEWRNFRARMIVKYGDEVKADGLLED